MIGWHGYLDLGVWAGEIVGHLAHELPRFHDQRPLDEFQAEPGAGDEGLQECCLRRDHAGELIIVF